MARTGGNRGGFNPYRNGGKFSTPGAAASGGEKVNAAIRNAAGRGTGGGTGGGGGGDDDPIVRRAAAMSAPDVSRISPANHAALTKAFAQVDGGDPVADSAEFYGGGINGVATHVLTTMLQRQMGNPKDAAGIARNKGVTDALLGCYADAGITPPRNLTPKRMLDIYDSVPVISNRGYNPETGEIDDTRVNDVTSDKATAHAIVSALSMGDLTTAQVIANDPSGAGIGWDLTRHDFCTKHGLPDDGKD